MLLLSIHSLSLLSFFIIPLPTVSALYLPPRDSGVGPNAKVNSFTYTGTACPQGSSMIQINENGTSMSFEEFAPSLGHRKDCTVTLDMSVNAGYKYRVNGLGTVLQGYMPLAKGWTLGIQASYQFKGPGGNSAASVNFSGPLDGDPLSAKGAPSPAGGITSPCGGGTFSAAYSASLSGTTSGTVPAPGPDVPWYVFTSVEWLRC